MISRFSILLLLILLWEVLAQLSIINTFLYSSPSHIFKTLSSLVQNGVLWKHIGITSYEVLCSFLLSSFIGIVVAFLLWRFPFFYKVLEPYITILNSLPKVALGPLIIIWVGSGISSIIFMALMISIFTTILNIYTGFVSTPDHYLLLFQSFHASTWQTFRSLILPYNIPIIQNTLKINISLSLIGVIMGELLVSKSGLGYLIMYGSQVFQLDLVITSIFVLAILSFVMYLFVDYLFVWLQKKRI